MLGFEVSRLARSCRDWYHLLLEICALAGTLIADSDGVYDPALYSDRLLLGLKGTMSEAELHIMRARLEQGRWHKAERSDSGSTCRAATSSTRRARWFSTPTSGSATPSGSSSMSSRAAASVHGVLRYLIDHGIALPDRDRGGPARGEVVWRRPHRGAILNLLTSPTYAGAYVFGRRRAEGHASAPAGAGQGSRAEIRRTGGCCCRIAGRPTSAGAPAGENRKRLDASERKHKGVPRGGPRCWRGSCSAAAAAIAWSPATATTARTCRYDCTHDQINHGAPHCQSLSGGTLDALVTGLILEVLRPTGDRGQPAAGRGRRAGAGAAAPPVGVAPGAGALRG